MNCSPETPWRDISDHLTKYSYTMMISGYNQRERYCAIKGAIERYNQLQQDVKNGSRECLYRSGNQIREQKAQKKDWSNTWFLKNEVRSTVSCPTTPGSSLK